MFTEAGLADAVRERMHNWVGGSVVADVIARLPQLRIYLAGGVVRNLVLGQPHDPRDFDLFLGGEGIETALGNLSAAGRLDHGPFGSPRWSPRTDAGVYADVIPIPRFHNGLWPCRDIVDALNQFDFTGNAIAVDLRTGELFDTQNGRRDLAEGVLRAVRFDYPDEPIAAGSTLGRNTVLWFRLLHYAAVCRLDIEPVTLAWLLRNRAHAAQKSDYEAAFGRLHPMALSVLMRDGSGGVAGG